jgi:hypothetical protein
MPSFCISQKGFPCSMAPVCLSSPRRMRRACRPADLEDAQSLAVSNLSRLIEHQHMIAANAISATGQKARHGARLDLRLLPQFRRR